MTLSRTGWLLTVVAGALVGTLGPTAPALVHALSGTSFPEALMALVSLAALLLAAWSLLTAILVMLGASSRVVAALTPALLRRALLAGAAGALVVGPAHAGQQAAPEPLRHSVQGLPLPDRPDVAGPASSPSPAVSPTDAIEVSPGDTLWDIAAAHLPDDASMAQIVTATAAWHRTNRAVIGADPDLIVPGQHLTPPNGKDHP